MCRGIRGRFLFSLAFSARIRSEAECIVPLAEDVTVRRIFPVGRRQSRESYLIIIVPRVASPWSLEAVEPIDTSQQALINHVSPHWMAAKR